MSEFSDDGATFKGAYGYRWRDYFKVDQIDWAINHLKENPNSRRCYIGMWDANHEPNYIDGNGKDAPCNVGICFSINSNTSGVHSLDMTVYNRSNDILWGAYGANAVHMSFLQEYISCSLDLLVGKYYQVSNNWHMYLNTPNAKDLICIEKEISDWDTYVDPYVDYFSIEMFSTNQKDRFDLELKLFLEDPFATGFELPFFSKLAKPMYAAHKPFKQNTGKKKYTLPLEILSQMPNFNDWRTACEEWIKRKYTAWEKAADGGVNYG